MSENKKPIKVNFAPGAFDHFEGTQEELDEMLKEITDMFTNLTPEELEARSRALTDEDFEELPEDVKEQLLRASDDDDLADEFKRKLQ